MSRSVRLCLLCAIGAFLAFLLALDAQTNDAKYVTPHTAITRKLASLSQKAFDPGFYTISINGEYTNGQVVASPFAGYFVNYGNINSQTAPTWRFVPGTYNGHASTWIFRTDLTPLCTWAPPMPTPVPISCECWTSGDGNNFTAFWNTDHQARGEPEDYEMFDFLEAAVGHYIVRNSRWSEPEFKFMILNSDGSLHLAEATMPGIVTVAVNAANPPPR